MLSSTDDDNRRSDNLGECGLRTVITGAVKFIIHFILVMILLCCGAMVFARLEDPEIMYGDDTPALNTTNNTFNRHKIQRDEVADDQDNYSDKKMSLFWTNMETKYNLSVHHGLREAFLRDINNFMGQKTRPLRSLNPSNTSKITTLRDDKHFCFMKWFYFVVIATTSIGYGDVSPKTDDGKLFYIFFSIIGIASMLTLLRSCGVILMAANTKFYTLVSRYLRRDKKWVSDEFMSVISMVFIFLLFMLFVVWHDSIIGQYEWSTIDTFYYWIVTFTTVGFGDVLFPLDVEVEHFYELTVYRVFGLSFLAGIIKSINKYLKYRQVMLIEEERKLSSKIKESFLGKKLGDIALPMGMGMLPDQINEQYHSGTIEEELNM